MEYFIWDNECAGFLSVKGGFTPVVHLAKRYPAENAVGITNSLNPPGAAVTIVPCRAPSPEAVTTSYRRSIGKGEDEGVGELSTLDPAFFIWDQKLQGYVRPVTVTTRRCGRANRYSAEAAMAYIDAGNIKDPDRYVPLRAPPPGRALQAFNAAMMELKP